MKMDSWALEPQNFNILCLPRHEKHISGHKLIIIEVRLDQLESYLLFVSHERMAIVQKPISAPKILMWQVHMGPADEAQPDAVTVKITKKIR